MRQGKLFNEFIWRHISKTLSHFSFAINFRLFKKLFPGWPADLTAGTVWFPHVNHHTHLKQAMDHFHIDDLKQFKQWTFSHCSEFWDYVIQQLKIVFKKPYEQICDLSNGVEFPNWLVGAKLNIVDSCFQASFAKPAILYLQNNKLCTLSYGELEKLTNQVVNGLIQQGFTRGDAIAIDMPMNYLAVVIYLGIIKFGGVVVSIADSFSAEEIAIRLKLARAKAIFTQDSILRSNKLLPLYEKVKNATDLPAIVVKTQETLILRKQDILWDNFLSHKTDSESEACDPMTNCNILFSSGTTGKPKAIPWKHYTGIKVASDAYFHQDIRPDDVLAWPTNLGWMMGPWLIFAALINQASIALYDDLPRERAFGEFIQQANVTLLGVVPTLVASWRQSKCMEGLDWSHIKLFSSTGECSNPEDMFYLMWLAGYKPIIEYCGGTEIGGAYITSTLLETNYPSVMTGPALGSKFILMDEKGHPAQNGEVALCVPSFGFSTELLNADHHAVYFEDMPKGPEGEMLRRHGDQICQLPNGYYSVLGRADDTMNLGAIKTSSAEIERVLVGIPGILETAAIATSGHGPSRLIIFASTQEQLEKQSIMSLMQKKINEHLNPLFKISDVVFVKELPKTASNKIMRRVLRERWEWECQRETSDK